MLKVLDLYRSVRLFRLIPEIPRQSTLVFQGTNVIPANKSKGKNRFNKTRIKHLHTGAVHVKTAELPVRIRVLMCFLIQVST